MKSKFTVFVVCLLLVSCASFTLPKNPTPEQVNAALCQDAQMGVIMGETMLAESSNPDQKAYWKMWLAGAKAGIINYCMKP